ncbi:MAG: hypothetical protein ACI8UD_003862 [Planctomycetota bacterium]|jgi:uncharacterized protein (TIGR01777 family)
MNVILAGGSGQVGRALAEHFLARNATVTTLGRSPDLPGQLSNEEYRRWDARTLGDWCEVLEGADLVINLAGRTVNCRYSQENMAQMMNSRVDSARVVGQAIAAAKMPPQLWLQMSTATIYAHRFDAANDDDTGMIGGDEEHVPDYWEFSVRIAKNWERELEQANTPRTRKVALRASMVMGPARKGIFDTLYGLTRLGLGGAIAGGKQFISWIHEHDFLRAIDFIVAQEDIHGPIIVAAPDALEQRQFQRLLRKAIGTPIGLPATAWMASIGAFLMRTDPELILKSRRVHPSRLLDRGFRFEYPCWQEAAQALVAARRVAAS